MSSAPEAFERWWQALPLPNDKITADHIRMAWDAGVLFERNACAAICDENDGGPDGITVALVAKEIRKRD